MSRPRLEIRKASGTTGAIVSGIDLAGDLDQGLCQEIRQALVDHCVVFFRRQDITPEQHVAFGRRFGETFASKVVPTVPGHPMVMELRKEPESTHNHGGNWHTDQAFLEVPPLGSILLAREIPEGGGDTVFANMYRAYETLSDGLKETLKDMRAIHAASKNPHEYASRLKASSRDPQKLPPREVSLEWSHPVVPIHPESGRRVLFVNPSYTVRFDGWTAQESAPLLNHLYAHATTPENMVRFHWEVGSIAFWDNRSCWHFAVQDYDGYRRVMHRVSLKGTGFGRA